MGLIQIRLYSDPHALGSFPVALDDSVTARLGRNAAVAIGVSGGKDSSAVALRTRAFLEEIGHAGPLILIHSDLGRAEWEQSLPVCERLATRLNVELVVVRRKAGDLLDRWRQRWANNVRRYASLSCVCLIPPWSTPSMRFCTSELKLDVIYQELRRRFVGREVVSVTGIRRQESKARSKISVARTQPQLTRNRAGTIGCDWHPILSWSSGDVFSYLQRERFALHVAYTIYGSTRVSCAFCILASKADLLASTACQGNQTIYRELVEIELDSTFSFQAGRWLADVAPELLPPRLREATSPAQTRAKERELAEREIPKRLLYTAGWPTCIPTTQEAELLARVRQRVARAVGIEIDYTEPEDIISRYVELMDAKAAR